LVLALVVLAVIPLAGVTVYSYAASERAFRRAVEVEAGTVAEEMGRRLESIARDLDRRLAGLGGPLETLLASEPQTAPVLAQLQLQMGDVAPLIESLELVSLPPPPPVPPGAPGPPPAPRPQDAEKVIVFAPDAAADTGLERAGRRWIVRHLEQGGAALDRHLEETARGLPGAWIAPEKREEVVRQARAALDAARKELLAEVAPQSRGTGGGRGAAEAARREQKKAAKAFLRQGILHTLRREGKPVGTVRVQLRPPALIAHVLERGARGTGEIPFAVDPDGQVFADGERRGRLAGLRLTPAASDRPAPEAQSAGGDEWIVVKRRDPDSGLTLGIARPVGEPLRQMRATAVRNLAVGLGMVAVALLGILPLSRRMTRDVTALTGAAERLAHGDLEARVPVRSGDELGRLAGAFNRMARDLRAHQDQVVEQARLRKELEMCRRIQEEMLPHGPLRAPFAEAWGVSIPAREVGGDFFNYFVLGEAEAALLVGDVSGKGVPAALLMANVQALLRARLPVERDLVSLADRLDHELGESTPPATYLTLFLGILDAGRRQLRYVSAGHNAPLLLRADGSIDALDSTGRPLGLLPGGGYEERRVALDDGDCLFLYTDGLVEAEDAAGEPFGIERVRSVLVRERTGGLDGILSRVEEAVRRHRGVVEAADDASLLVLRIRTPGTQP
jgi:serine phosphatase RsbU (regulator of sigma subunit)